MGNIKNSKAFIFTDEAEAVEMANRFGINYTSAVPNNDGSQFMVIIRMMDAHILTQAERELLIEIPTDFIEL